MLFASLFFHSVSSRIFFPVHFDPTICCSFGVLCVWCCAVSGVLTSRTVRGTHYVATNPSMCVRQCVRRTWYWMHITEQFMFRFDFLWIVKANDNNDDNDNAIFFEIRISPSTFTLSSKLLQLQFKCSPNTNTYLHSPRHISANITSSDFGCRASASVAVSSRYENKNY